VPIGRALVGLRRVTAGTRELAALRHGQQGPLQAFLPGEAGEAALVLDGMGRVAAVIEMGSAASGWRLVRLIAE
jgi:hypothetical protein